MTVFPQGVVLAPTPVENLPFSDQVVATFLSDNLFEADHTALIHWGDGDTSPGTIQFVGIASGGFQYAVLGDHTYA